MLATRIQSALVGTALLLGIDGFAQQPPPPLDRAQAQLRYESEIAACNRGNLPAPAREACVRSAGTALDSRLGGPPTESAVPSSDGRATVVAPTGSVTPPAGSNTVTSGDGRATIVLPADRTAVPSR
ncbi:hypothetical protein [Variovorax sp. ZT4R33]|uniref:hypothetical protein n=1 Tax=Variovorax sp. ZT4R33 TaxID=3443743 RepID=UPI003F45A42B